MHWPSPSECSAIFHAHAPHGHEAGAPCAHKLLLALAPARCCTGRYDRGSSGAIDAVGLGNLLEDLGVNPTEERLQTAFSEFDHNGDGLVTLPEFEAWWRRMKSLTY